MTTFKSAQCHLLTAQGQTVTMAHTSLQTINGKLMGSLEVSQSTFGMGFTGLNGYTTNAYFEGNTLVVKGVIQYTRLVAGVRTGQMQLMAVTLTWDAGSATTDADGKLLATVAIPGSTVATPEGLDATNPAPFITMDVPVVNGCVKFDV